MYENSPIGCEISVNCNNIKKLNWRKIDCLLHYLDYWRQKLSSFDWIKSVRLAMTIIIIICLWMICDWVWVKRPLVWDQESGSNPVVSFKGGILTHWCFVLRRQVKSPRWFESTWGLGFVQDILCCECEYVNGWMYWFWARLRPLNAGT